MRRPLLSEVALPVIIGIPASRTSPTARGAWLYPISCNSSVEIVPLSKSAFRTAIARLFFPSAITFWASARMRGSTGTGMATRVEQIAATM